LVGSKMGSGSFGLFRLLAIISIIRTMITTIRRPKPMLRPWLLEDGCRLDPFLVTCIETVSLLPAGSSTI